MRHWMVVATLVVLFIAVAAFVFEPPRYAAADGDKPEYVGPAECKACHFKQFKSWGKSPLSQAFEHLKPDQSVEAKKKAELDPKKDYTKDPTCLKCHTTAYGKPTGYPELVEGQAWTDDQTACATRNEGVTCEACHGPGSLVIPFKKENKEYKRAQIAELGALAPVTAENCAHCHKKECPTMPDDYKFDFETARKSDKMHDHKDLKYDH
jgi:hypothetical protein